MDNFFGLAERITSLFKTSTGIDVYSKAQKLVSEYHMLDKIEGGVCVGFSGGADSVMLMCFLLEIRRQMNLSFPIVAVHINHGIRGDEADRDEAFCRNFCVSLGVEFVSKKFDIPKIAKNLKRGLEEVARDIRYAEFAFESLNLYMRLSSVLSRYSRYILSE